MGMTVQCNPDSTVPCLIRPLSTSVEKSSLDACALVSYFQQQRDGNFYTPVVLRSRMKRHSSASLNLKESMFRLNECFQ